MTLYRGRDIRLTITTEATGSAIITSSTDIRTSTTSAEATSSAAAWIPTLTDTRSDDYESAFRQANIEALEVNVEPTNEEFELIGRVQKEYPKTRDAFEVTVTRKMEHAFFAQLFNLADHGVSETASTTNSWRPSTDQRAVTDGFRLHVWTYTNSALTFRNAALKEYTITTTPNKITVEKLVFSGNLWTASSSAVTTSTSASEL